MLVEKSRNLQVGAEVTVGNYTFRTEYRVSGKSELMGVNVQVYKQQEQINDYIGSMSLEAGNKSICIRDTEQVAELLQTFEAIVAEIKAALVTESAVSKK